MINVHNGCLANVERQNEHVYSSFVVFTSSEMNCQVVRIDDLVIVDKPWYFHVFQTVLIIPYKSQDAPK